MGATVSFPVGDTRAETLRNINAGWKTSLSHSSHLIASVWLKSSPGLGMFGMLSIFNSFVPAFVNRPHNAIDKQAVKPKQKQPHANRTDNYCISVN